MVDDPTHEVPPDNPHRMSFDEANTLLQGDFGDVLREGILSHTTFIAFGSAKNGQFLGCGSGTLLRTPVRLVLVTCAHVYKAIIEAKAVDQSVETTVGGVAIDLESRLIESGASGDPDDVDIATFEISDLEIASMAGKKSAASYWPPQVPGEHRPVLIAGFPRTEIQQTRSSTGFGFFFMLTGTKRVTDRQIIIDLAFDDMHWAIIRGSEARPGYETGGLSGGPVFSLLQKRSTGIILWALGGIISEGNYETDTLTCEPADRIRANGSIRR